MRITLPFGRAVFFAGALAVALFALFPLRLALGGLADAGFSAREATGSVWRGRLVEARVAGAPLGDLDAALRPLPLLLGRARTELARAGEGAPLAGALIVSRHGIAIDGVTAHIPLGAGAGPLPLAAIDLSSVSVAFRDGLCERADGLVRAEVVGDVAGIALPGGLSGGARCEGGALLLPLASQSGMERLTVTLRGGGTWRAELAVRPSGAASPAALLASGFTPSPEGYVLRIDGAR